MVRDTCIGCMCVLNRHRLFVSLKIIEWFLSYVASQILATTWCPRFKYCFHFELLLYDFSPTLSLRKNLKICELMTWARLKNKNYCTGFFERHFNRSWLYLGGNTSLHSLLRRKDVTGDWRRLDWRLFVLLTSLEMNGMRFLSCTVLLKVYRTSRCSNIGLRSHDCVFELSTLLSLRSRLGPLLLVCLAFSSPSLRSNRGLTLLYWISLSQSAFTYYSCFYRWRLLVSLKHSTVKYAFPWKGKRIEGLQLH
jgi:hypothetical protein